MTAPPADRAAGTSTGEASAAEATEGGTSSSRGDAVDQPGPERRFYCIEAHRRDYPGVASLFEAALLLVPEGHAVCAWETGELRPDATADRPLVTYGVPIVRLWVDRRPLQRSGGEAC